MKSSWMWAKKLVLSALQRIGVSLIRTGDLQALVAQAQSNAHSNLAEISASLNTDTFELLRAASFSRSQLGQEIVALALSDYKPGFFVEFGATDGLSLSNTYALETEYGWRGILAEPGRQWHIALQTNRDCIIDHRAVYSTSGQTLGFIEDGELGTVKGFESNDLHKHIRKTAQSYSVKSVSLDDLLEDHKAPTDIGFISIDTEGSELDILSTFDFSRYRVRFFCIEHNFSSTRAGVLELLTKNGYTRVLEGISAFDDWYVANSLRDRFV